MSTATKALSIVPPQKKNRKRIIFIERCPQAEWFSQGRDQAGRRVWFFHLEITGLLPRKFGPFVSKRKALMFFDSALNELLDALSDAGTSLYGFQIPNREFASYIGHYPIVEHPVAIKGGRQ